MVMGAANEETSLSIGFDQVRTMVVIRFTLAFDNSYRPSTLFCWFLATTALKRKTLETHRTASANEKYKYFVRKGKNKTRETNHIINVEQSTIRRRWKIGNQFCVVAFVRREDQIQFFLSASCRMAILLLILWSRNASKARSVEVVDQVTVSRTCCCWCWRRLSDLGAFTRMYRRHLVLCIALDFAQSVVDNLSRLYLVMALALPLDAISSWFGMLFGCSKAESTLWMNERPSTNSFAVIIARRNNIDRRSLKAW